MSIRKARRSPRHRLPTGPTERPWCDRPDDGNACRATLFSDLTCTHRRDTSYPHLQRVEVLLASRILNRMTHLGMPHSYRVT